MRLCKFRTKLLLLCFILILSTSSCSFDSLLKNDGILNRRAISLANSRLNQEDFILKLIAGIADPSQIQNIYSSIPETQLDHISYATFDAYMRVLARSKSSSSTVVSFRFPSQEERLSLLGEIAAKAPTYKELLLQTYPVRLQFSKDNGSGPPFYLFFQLDEDGYPYLSSVWVQESLRLYHTAELYFEALAKQNEAAVASLLNSGNANGSGQFSQAVIERKARELVDFYHVRVQSSPSDFQLTALNISWISFLQLKVLDDSLTEYKTRTVNFVRTNQDSISVRDNISSPLESKDFYLYFNDEKAVRLGDQAYPGYVSRILGDPKMTAFGVDFTLGLEDDKASNKLIYLSYPSLTMTVGGNYYDGGSWDGQIVRMIIRDSNSAFRLGERIYVGMSQDELLLLYPFADQSDYNLKTEIDDKTYSMSFVFSQDESPIVEEIRLEIVR